MNDAKPTPARSRSGCGRALLWFVVVGSLLLNFVLCGFVGFRHVGNEDADLPEKTLWGEESARDKVAVIRVEGVLMDGMTRYFLQQIEQAAADDKVKVVVLRVDSPGGTVSASEDIYRLLEQLRDGKMRKYPDSKPKKIVVSMGSIAASGGYYVAMPGERLFAEQTTITGSIGVYASLPNVAGFIHRHGVKFELIKAGGIKAAGSPFHEMTPQERQPWQEMVDFSYDHFLGVVQGGRPELTKDKLRNEVLLRTKIDVHDDKGNVVTDWLGQPVRVDYVRYRADGGTFTAPEALKYGLIDEIGTLEQAVEAAAKLANLGKHRVVAYAKPPSLLNSLLGISMRTSANFPDSQRLSFGATPRLWFLAPQADLAGLLSALGKD